MRRATLLLSAGILAAACTRTWTPVDDAQMGFSIDFPASPVPTSDGEMTALVAEDLGWTYSLHYASIPDGLEVDRSYLEKVRDHLLLALPGHGLDTGILEVPNGLGLSFTARGDKNAVLVGRIYRVDRRVFAVEILGARRVAESPDAKRFFDSFSITPRAISTPKPPPPPHIDRRALRSAAESYVALVRTGRYGEAYRYLPASARARVPAGAHAAYWKRAGDLDDAEVASVAVRGTAGDVVVTAHGAKIDLEATLDGNGQPAITPAALVAAPKPRG